MAIISGINESRVSKPSINKMEQKTSAKIVSCKEAATPMPIGSGNFSSRSL